MGCKHILAVSYKNRLPRCGKLPIANPFAVSTLREVLQSMGATLKISARFENGVERLLEIGEAPAASPSHKAVGAG